MKYNNLIPDLHQVVFFVQILFLPFRGIISQCYSLFTSLMGSEKAFCHAAGLKEGETQEDRITHAAPDGSRQVIRC